MRAAIDRFVYYAGWADKYQQVFSTVNPVSSSPFQLLAARTDGRGRDPRTAGIGAARARSVIAPVICGGNTAIALASTASPLPAVTLAEVLATSDLPGGVVNLLTGQRADLLDHFASHMDVNACIYCGADAAELTRLRTKAVR